MLHRNACRALAPAVVICLAIGSLGHGESQGVKTHIPFSEAKPICESLRPDLLPSELRGKTLQELALLWPAWVARRDVEIRRRVFRGDEDSLVNFLFYGVTFTREPRLSENDVFTGLSDEAKKIVARRIDDIIIGIAQPGANERLQFARSLVERQGIDPTTAAGREQLRTYLRRAVDRTVADAQVYIRENRAQLARQRGETTVEVPPGYSLYRTRGLSSDTSIFADFGIDQALELLKSNGTLSRRSIRRVAILGPGLDFTDKRDGYDFYPQQTIQPFAVAESLVRLDLSPSNDLRVTTFDLSDRVNQHLETARARAREGISYLIHVPRDPYEWNPRLVRYWKEFGSVIGEETNPAVVPPAAAGVQVRAIKVRPSVVLSMVPQDLNIVLQRIEPSDTKKGFDLMIATNVFLYYEVFEQSLALTNVAKMLRPGAGLLTNNPVLELPSIPLVAIGHTDVVYNNRSAGQDRIFFYERH